MGNIEKTVAENPAIPFESFSIIPWVYEADLDKKYGLVLGELKRNKRLPPKVEKNVPFKEGEFLVKNEVKRRLLRKLKALPDFCCMEVKDMDELQTHIKTVYEVSYSHYAWAKTVNMYGSFPEWCCGDSSRNTRLNLMHRGYPNATYVCNIAYDHAYVALPFVLKQDNREGFIILDPTSDQMFDNKKSAPRNNIFVVFGRKWEYRTDWKKRQDLFPHASDRSQYANLHTLRANVEYSPNMDDYFSEVFNNPVQVKIRRAPRKSKKS